MERLPFDDEVERSTGHIYPKVEKLVTEAEWRLYAPYIHRINRLKKERDAVILAHNYQRIEIFHGIADYTGDSLGLARKAKETDAETIVMCGVEFMAETAKLINPDRRVLLPSDEAGCSLAESITPEDVEALRADHPDTPVVTYVNTSAAVKAASDICCTSSNAVEVVEAIADDRAILVPDDYLAGYVASQTDIEIVNWEGTCVVHEDFRTSDIEALRRQYPDIAVAAHPECSPEVQSAADVVGSTSNLIGFVEENRPERVALITECTMSDNISIRFSETDFVQPCSLCPYMKSITLEQTLDALRGDAIEIEIEPDTARKARRSVERMFEV